MKLASRSAIESESSAKAGSIVSRGRFDCPPLLVGRLRVLRNDVRELGLKGVVGREAGGWLRDADGLALISAIGAVAAEEALW